jgi:hypothetical protein
MTRCGADVGLDATHCNKCLDAANGEPRGSTGVDIAGIVLV